MKNQYVIVTGAASGIGQALAIRLLDAGHHVCVCDLNGDALQGIYTRYADRAVIKTLDVRDVNGWQAVISICQAQWPRIDVLCNVAGILRDNWIPDVTTEDIDLHLDINVKGTLYGTQAAVSVMQQQKAGHIINIASMAALTPVPGLALYSASKFAVRAYSLAAAMELKPLGIAVTTICPDAVQTPMLDQQKGREQAALTFSGRKTLTVDDVVNSIMNHVLPDRPMEVVLPLERGVIAKLSNAFPQLSDRFVGVMRQHGMKRQKKPQ